jgi:hypothetical protein
MGKSIRNGSADDLLKDLQLDQIKPTVQVSTKKPAAEGEAVDSTQMDQSMIPGGQIPPAAAADSTAKPATGDSSQLLKDLELPEKKNSTPPSSAPSKLPSSAPPTPGFDREDATEFLKNDYFLNRNRVDPALKDLGFTTAAANSKQLPANGQVPVVAPSELGTQPASGSPLVANQKILDGFVHNITDQKTGSQVLGAYYKTRLSQLEQDLHQSQEDVGKRYPIMAMDSGGMRLDQKGYDQELQKVQADYESRKNRLALAVDVLANDKIVNEARHDASPNDVHLGNYIDVTKFGREKRRVLGDDKVDAEERKQAKGIKPDPSDSYNNDKVGLSVIKSALGHEVEQRATKDDQGNIVSIPEDLKGQLQKVDQQEKGMLAKHSDYRKQQVGKAISDRLYQNKNYLQRMTGAYTVSKDDIQRTAKELGLAPELYQDVESSDIKTANMFGTFINEAVQKPAAGLGALIGRPFRKYVLGQDPDLVDEHYDELKKRWTTALADAPDAQSQFGPATMVNTQAGTDNFLEDVNNPKRNKFNWNADVIANTVTGMIGTLTQFVAGGEAAKGLLNGAAKLGQASEVVNGLTTLANEGAGGMAAVAAAKGFSSEAGMAAYTFLTMYDDGYEQAKKIGIEGEGAANAFAAIRAATNAYVFTKLLPVERIGQMLGENVVQTATGEAVESFYKLVQDKGLDNLTKAGVMPIVRSVIKESAKDIGKVVALSEIDKAAEFITSEMFKPGSTKDRDFLRESTQSAISMAVGMLIPSSMGAYRAKKSESNLFKTMMYDVGSDPVKYINAIQDVVESGGMKQEDANDRYRVIAKMMKAVQITPNYSLEAGKPLSERNRMDYASSLLREQVLQEKLKEVDGDEVQTKAISKEIDEVKKQREIILQNADGVERNSEGEPIVAASTEEETPLDKFKAQYRKDKKHPTEAVRQQAEEGLKKMDEDPVSFLKEKLAQTVEVDGEDRPVVADEGERKDIQKQIDELSDKVEVTHENGAFIVKKGGKEFGRTAHGHQAEAMRQEAEAEVQKAKSSKTPNSNENGNRQEQHGNEGQEGAAKESGKPAEKQPDQQGKEDAEQRQVLKDEEGEELDASDALPSRFRPKKPKAPEGNGGAAAETKKEENPPAKQGGEAPKEGKKGETTPELTDEEKQIVDGITEHKGLPDHLSGMLRDDPKGLVQELRDQVAQGEKGGAENKTLESAEKMFGKKAVDLVRKKVRYRERGAKPGDRVKYRYKDEPGTVKSISHGVATIRYDDGTSGDLNIENNEIYREDSPAAPAATDRPDVSYLDDGKTVNYGEGKQLSVKDMSADDIQTELEHAEHDNMKAERRLQKLGRDRQNLITTKKTNTNAYKSTVDEINELTQDMKDREEVVIPFLKKQLEGPKDFVKEHVIVARPSHGEQENKSKGNGEQKKEQPKGEQQQAKAEKTEEEQIRERLEDAKKDFWKSLRGNLNMNINPEAVAKGAKVLALYAELGIHKFSEIMKDLARSFGRSALDKETVDAIKGVYSYYRSSLPKEERDIKTEREEQVDDFIENELPKINNDEYIQKIQAAAQPATSAEAGRSTSAIESEARSVITESEAAKTDKEQSESIEKIDGLVSEIDRKLKLAGYYEADGSMPSDYGDKSGEKAFKKDLVKFSKGLAKLLGYEHDRESKGKKKEVFADTNIPPAGGDGTIILWKPGSKYGVYISIPVQKDGYTSGGGYSPNLVIQGILSGSHGDVMWRVTTRDKKIFRPYEPVCTCRYYCR